jgi:hypothetical protein
MPRLSPWFAKRTDMTFIKIPKKINLGTKYVDSEFVVKVAKKVLQKSY